jgi:hypothetical protein
MIYDTMGRRSRSYSSISTRMRFQAYRKLRSHNITIEANHGVLSSIKLIRHLIPNIINSSPHVFLPQSLICRPVKLVLIGLRPADLHYLLLLEAQLVRGIVLLDERFDEVRVTTTRRPTLALSQPTRTLQNAP